MPLGTREHDDTVLSVGVEIGFLKETSKLVHSYTEVGKFDFIVVPLRSPDYRPSKRTKSKKEDAVVQIATQMSAESWNKCVIGQISTWIDLDSADTALRKDSEIVLKEELSLAVFLSLQACILPAPKGTSCMNYAASVLRFMRSMESNMQLWLRIPLEKKHEYTDSLVDYWTRWNSFRLLCDLNSHLWVALDCLDIQSESDPLLRGWYGEPVAAFILHPNSFHKDSLVAPLDKIVGDVFQRSIKVIFSPDQPTIADKKGSCRGPTSSQFGMPAKRDVRPADQHDTHRAIGDPFFRSYREVLSATYKKIELLPIIFDVVPPRSRNKNALVPPSTENHNRYSQYGRAICQALRDRVPDDNASEITTELVIVGAGQGHLVRTSVQAAQETSRKIKIYAVERDLSAVDPLKELISREDIGNIVTIVVDDIKHDTADILVSDFLGSFGGNELSLECVDDTLCVLKKDGISIPSAHTSFLRPVTASKLYNDIKEKKDMLLFETAFPAKFLNVAWLAQPQPIFTVIHPNLTKDDSNQQYNKLVFVMPDDDRDSVMVHGFAGYFAVNLYNDVHIITDPSQAPPTTPTSTWYTLFFPLKTPLSVSRGSSLEVHFWHFKDSTKVWYEWCVTSPFVTSIHNSNGCAFSLEL